MGVPADTDEITQEWLTAALHQAGALDQARVTSIQPAPIGQLGFTGQIRRLQISYDKPEPCAPRSLVAKFSATHPEARAAVHSMGFYEREIGFYRELAADCPVRTPRCYFGEVQMDSGASLLLLEDLSWMQNLDSAGGSVDESELVIREVAKLHAAWWNDAHLDQIPWLAMKGMLTPDQALLVFTQNWESFLGKLSVPVTEDLLAAGDICRLYLRAVSVAMYSGPPRTLIHNDVQGDNLLVGRRWRTVTSDCRLAADDTRPSRPRSGRLPRRPSRNDRAAAPRESSAGDVLLSDDPARHHRLLL